MRQLQMRPLRRNMDAACVLEKLGVKVMHHTKVRKRKNNLIKHILALNGLLLPFLLLDATQSAVLP